MGTTYVVASGKGGVGKTTVVASLGAACARLGCRVLVVDAAVGTPGLDLALGLEGRYRDDLVAAVRREVPAAAAILPHPHVAGLDALLVRADRPPEELGRDALRGVLDALGDRYALIFVDAPAGIDRNFRAAAAVADRAILVTVAELAPVRDADRIMGLLREEAGLGEADVMLVVNRYRERLVARGLAPSARDAQALLGIDLLAVIPEDPAVIRAGNRGEPVVLRRDSPAGRALAAAARRLVAPPAGPSLGFWRAAPDWPAPG